MMRSKMTSLSSSFAKPENNLITAQRDQEMSCTWDLASGCCADFRLIILQELNVVPDELLLDQLFADGLSKLKGDL